MITTSFSYTQSKRGNLGLADIDARRAGSCLRADAVTFEQRNHRLFDSRNQAPDTEAHARDVEQSIQYQLTRAMIGNLPAAVDLHHRDAAGIQ